MKFLLDSAKFPTAFSMEGLMPDQMQVSAPDLYLCSPQNYIYQVLDEKSVEYVLNEYETAKRSVPPIIASDGSFIRREGYWDDELDDDVLFEYFVNNVVDKDPNYTYNDPNYPLATAYEAWLDDVYGRTEMGKFWDYMETLDGIQDALDVIGLVWDGADVINLFISVCRGDWERAAWSFVGTLPLAGSLIARAGRGVTKTSKAIAGKVITGAANAAAGARTVVKELELTISALGEEFEHFKKLLQNMVEDIKKTGKAILETPISIRIERVSLQFADGGYVGFGGYRIIINFADDVESAVGGGRKTEKVLGGGLGGGSNTIYSGRTCDILKNSSESGQLLVNGQPADSLNGLGLSSLEKKTWEDLLRQVNIIDIIPVSEVSGVKMADSYLNGIRTELKAMSGSNTNTMIKRIEDCFKKPDTYLALVDVRNGTITLQQAQEVIASAERMNKIPSGGKVIIWTNEGFLFYP